jgi:molybdenum cofactor biosynthesis enzyme MoaA
VKEPQMKHKSYDFANILFAGPCNLRCPYCIGQQVDPALNRNNLDEFPLRNIDNFVDLLKRHHVTEVVFTGTTTDPQLYRHEARLLAWLRERLPPVKNGRGEKAVQYALHTNGQLALRKMEVLNQYSRVCISFPSFKPDTYQKMTGFPRPPHLAEIVRQAQVPVKVSCLINEHNVGEVNEFLGRCRDIGIERLVFRKLYGDTRKWGILGDLPQVSVHRHNPVYDYQGMEVTYWNFDQTSSRSLNLFSDGTISPHYLLTRARSDP